MSNNKYYKRLACDIALASKGPDIEYKDHEKCLNILAKSKFGATEDVFSRSSLSHFVNCSRNFNVMRLKILSYYVGYAIEILDERYLMVDILPNGDVVPIQRGIGREFKGESGHYITDYVISSNGR